MQIHSPSSRVVAVDLHAAVRDHGTLFARVFGKVAGPQHKFAHLTRAFANTGTFIHVPADIAIDEPIVVTYRAGDDATFFPYTVVLVEGGATVTIVERIEAGRNSLISGVTEIVTAE